MLSRSTGECFSIKLTKQVGVPGVEPGSRAYQTRALTIVLYPSGEGGNRTHLSQFAKLACYLNQPQSPTSESNRDAAGCSRCLVPQSRTECAVEESNLASPKARVLQTPLFPRTRHAESGGVEPLALRLRRFSKPLGAQPHAIQEEGRGIEPPGFHLPRFSRPLEHHCSVPSTAPRQGFEPQLPGSEPGVLPIRRTGYGTPGRSRTHYVSLWRRAASR